MKEHPDYKYRPRRKPKSLTPKKETKLYPEVGRSLLPPPPPLLDPEVKLPLLPPFPYPLYRLEDLGQSKMADLAFHALYGKSLYSAAVAAASWQGPCGCPERPPSPEHVI